MEKKNKTTSSYVNVSGTNNIPGTTFIPLDDGLCHCDEICPCCGKRKRRPGYYPYWGYPYNYTQPSITTPPGFVPPRVTCNCNY